MPYSPLRLGLWVVFVLFGCLRCAPAQQATPASLYIEGYTDQVSFAPGDTIRFHIATSAPEFEMSIRRVGASTTEVWRKEGLHAGDYPVPDDASSHGCDWPAALELECPADWPSGYYEATLRAVDQGGQFVHRNRRTAESGLYFVVREKEPGRTSTILLQLATNTYNAYTNWGGHSLYGFHARDKLQGNRVSFHRPQSSQFHQWEVHFVRWAEQNGYALEFAANSDLEFHPELLEKYRLVLSVGHDEYWSSAMRDHLEEFIAKGGNVAFFSGNTCCWQVRSEENGAALTCWKQWFNQDPLYRVGDHRLLATLWSHHLIERPENQLTGVGFLWGGYHRSHGQFMDGSGAYTVHQPEHWAFQGVNLQRGDAFGGKDTIVGYECDGCELTWTDGVPSPTYRDGTPRSFEVLATAPARWAPGDSFWYDRFPTDRVGAAVLGVYRQGGEVFTCGSTDWAHGLRGGDPIVGAHYPKRAGANEVGSSATSSAKGP